MSNYENAFETVVARGVPVGGTALLERVEQDLSVAGQVVATPSRRFSGLSVAAIVFVAVLAFGGLWALFVQPGGGPISSVDEFGVEWIEVRDEIVMHDSVVAGPGGFVYLPFGAGRVAFEFSSDGRNWSEVELPGVDGFAFVRFLDASSNMWFIMIEQRDVVTTWRSSDGRTWSSVVWPDPIEDTVDQVVASGDGFLAISHDVFGDGTTVWWSGDGGEWAEINPNLPGDIDDGSLRGTSAGIAWLPRVDAAGPQQMIYHSADGASWVEGTIELPPELAVSPTRWKITGVEYVNDQWVALAEIDRTGAEPVIHVWTSPDGVDWAAQGIPEFGLVADRAVSLSQRQSAVIGDILVIAPAHVAIAEGEDGIVSGNGGVFSNGELWATTDGGSWTRVLQTRDEIVGVAGAVTDDSGPIGLWVRRPRAVAEQTVVVTTGIVVPPQDLDQVGLDLQAEIVADGVVTEEEFREALEGWQACMEDLGVTGVHFDIDPQGGFSRGYNSPEPTSGEVESAICDASYVERVADALHR